MLLAEGADIETKDTKAAGRRYGRRDSRYSLRPPENGARGRRCRLLLANGADIETKDNDGRTPLSWAARMARAR